MNDYEEPPEEYRGYEIRVYRHDHPVFRYQASAFPKEINETAKRSETDIGQTAEEAYERVKTKIDRNWAMGS